MTAGGRFRCSNDVVDEARDARRSNAVTSILSAFAEERCEFKTGVEALADAILNDRRQYATRTAAGGYARDPPYRVLYHDHRVASAVETRLVSWAWQCVLRCSELTT